MLTLEVLAVAGPLAVVMATVVLFLVFLMSVYRLLRWLWGRLPSSVLLIQAEQLNKTLGVLLSLALFPDVIFYAWSVVESLISFVPAFIRTLSAFPFQNSCTTGEAACVAELSRTLILLMGEAAGSIVGAIDLPQFPVVSFIWFLLSAVVATQIIGLIHRELSTGKIPAWAASAAAVVPPALWQRVIFTILVLVSFYLGLSALLAIPLFQDTTRAEQITVDALAKALDQNLFKPDVFEATNPPNLPSLGDSSTPSTIGEARRQVFIMEFEGRKRYVQELQTQWTAIRSAVLNDQNSLPDRAKTLFSAGIEKGGGRKQTAKHYYDLLLWHQQRTQGGHETLYRCRNAATIFVATASQTLDRLRALEPVAAVEPTTIADRDNGEERQQLSRSYYDAFVACRLPDDSQLSKIPERPSTADMLSTVGVWTRWLLDTEQMPVVIIVGLVGFSLLGATVSRAVRLGQEKPQAALTLDDLLIVIASGTTAAVVVFLAAYGGLALLGSSGGDPNPYIVFATCLIGAVYSEDVWAWARLKLGVRGKSPGQDGKRSTLKVTEIDPNEGPPGGDEEVRIIGAGFVDGGRVIFEDEPTRQLRHVDFNRSKVNVMSGTEILAKTPPHPEGTVDVTVLNPDGQSDTLPQSYTYKEVSTNGGGQLVPKIEPDRGSTTGGDEVKITRTGFSSVKEMTFGCLLVPVDDTTFDNATSTIVALTPQHEAGEVEVTVTNDEGETVKVDNKYTYM